MLSALLEHSYKGLERQHVSFYFIEKNSCRLNHLKKVIKERFPELPDHIKVRFIEGDFDDSYTSLKKDIQLQNELKAPCFAMVDPFGISGIPMSLIKEILNNPKAEVYVSFMYSYINRFKKHNAFEAHLDELFGCQSWRAGFELSDANERKSFYYQLYKSQLKKSGAQHVVHLDLYNGNRLIYALFFATKHFKGADKMKEVIWKLTPEGDFAFYGTHSNQLRLTTEAPDYNVLIAQLKSKYKGEGWISIETIQAYVGSDKTDYHTGQIKSNALKVLEKSNEIVIKEGTRKRKMTYPKGTLIKFL
jgi:three-Cys-motif partner protein